MLKLLIIFLIAFLLYRVIRIFYDANKSVREHKKDGKVNEMVQDPHCKVYLPLRDAHRRIIGEKEYFFCSKECGDKFERDMLR